MADWTGYFPSAGVAPHDCAYSATWTDTTATVRYPGLTTRGTTDIAAQQCHKTAANIKGLGGQWVFPSQAARNFTTADTFDFVFSCADSAGSGTAYLYLVIRVFNAAGDTVVGTLYDGRVNSVLMASSIYSRFCSGVSVQNNVALPENGHIVVEIGVDDAYAATFNNPIYPQDLGIGGALPLNDTDTSQQKYPWLAITYGSDPNITLPITGVSGTASVGTLALSAALALSGLVGTGAVGTLAQTATMPVSGIEAPASVGTMTPDMAAIAAGIAALGEAGTAGQSVTVALTGNVATGEVGTPVVEGWCSVGDVAPSGAIPLTGATATGAVGIVVAEIGMGPDITIPITGVSAGPAYQISGVAATGAVGTVTPVEVADIILPLTGVSGTGAVGGVVYLTLGGWAATGEVGTVAPNASPPVTGNEATAAVGGVGLDRSVGLNGASASGEVGGWNIIARPVTGNAATGEVGTVAPRLSKAATGNAGTASIGSVTQSHDVALTGAAGTGVAGYMDTLIAGDVVRPLTGVAAAASVGMLSCGTASPTYVNVTPRKRILDVRPRRRIIDVFRRRA